MTAKPWQLYSPGHRKETSSTTETHRRSKGPGNSQSSIHQQSLHHSLGSKKMAGSKYTTQGQPNPVVDSVSCPDLSKTPKMQGRSLFPDYFNQNDHPMAHGFPSGIPYQHPAMGSASAYLDLLLSIREARHIEEQHKVAQEQAADTIHTVTPVHSPLQTRHDQSVYSTVGSVHEEEVVDPNLARLGLPTDMFSPRNKLPMNYSNMSGGGNIGDNDGINKPFSGPSIVPNHRWGESTHVGNIDYFPSITGVPQATSSTDCVDFLPDTLVEYIDPSRVLTPCTMRPQTLGISIPACDVSMMLTPEFLRCLSQNPQMQERMLEATLVANGAIVVPCPQPSFLETLKGKVLPKGHPHRQMGQDDLDKLTANEADQLALSNLYDQAEAMWLSRNTFRAVQLSDIMKFLSQLSKGKRDLLRWVELGVRCDTELSAAEDACESIKTWVNASQCSVSVWVLERQMHLDHLDLRQWGKE